MEEGGDVDALPCPLVSMMMGEESVRESHEIMNVRPSFEETNMGEKPRVPRSLPQSAGRHGGFCAAHDSIIFSVGRGRL